MTVINIPVEKLLGLFLVLFTPSLFAQKIDYKDGLLKTDAKDLAKITRLKDKSTFGLTSNYELWSLSGEKLAIAVLATEFEEDRNNNTLYYYRVTFLPLDLSAIFSLSKLGAEKSFAKLVGEAGIISNDQLDAAKVKELIATKGKTPRIPIDYTLVTRNLGFPVKLNNGAIEQQYLLVGYFKDVSRRPEIDAYQFTLPSGIVVATVAFPDGNNAKKYDVITYRDGNRRTVSINFEGSYGKIIARSENMDRNHLALQRIINWLVENRYL